MKRLIGFVLLSALLHTLLFGVLSRRSPDKPKRAVQRVTMTVVTPKKELPPPQEPPPVVVEKTPKEIIKQKVIPKVEPPVVSPPIVKKITDAPPPPVVAGVSEQSVSTTGNGPSVAVGNTTNAAPVPGNKEPVKPLEGQGKTQGEQVLSAGQVSQPAQVVGDCPQGNLRDLYTPQAVEQEIEGKVVLEVVIDEMGQVKQVRVIKGVGAGLDEAAMRAMKQSCHFKPAERDGQKVVSKIKYTFSFVLDE